MTDAVLEIVKGLCPGRDEELLRLLCAAACETLDGLLREGVKPEDCGGCYPLAAAWMAADWMRDCGGGGEITALTAGDMSVRRENGGQDGKLSGRAMELMAPYIRDAGFVFRGVRG